MTETATAESIQGKEGFFNLLTISQRAFGIYIVLVLIILISIAPFISYPCKTETSYVNLFVLGVSLLSGLGVLKLAKLASNSKVGRFLTSRGAFRAFVLFGSVLLVSLQLIIVENAWFKTGWDVQCITQPWRTDLQQYYSNYPNQLFLAGVFEKLQMCASLLGHNDGYLVLVAGSCLCITSSLALTTFSAKRIGGYKLGYLTFFVGFFIVGLSPWMLVPYSDTYGMLFVAIVFWSYIFITHPIVKWTLLPFFIYLGYGIKPTVAFIGFAIALLELSTLAKKRDTAQAFTLTCPVLLSILARFSALALGILIGMSTVYMMQLKISEIDPEMAFSPTHFLMMGFNQNTSGVFSADDVAFSRSFTTKNERQIANIQEWVHRTLDSEPQNLVKLIVKKTCCAYGDGTFAWEREGAFYTGEGNPEDNIVKRIYGITYLQNPFETLCQIAWFLILLGISIGGLRHKTPNKTLSIISLTLFMLSVFLTIFECRARYLFLYMPLFTLLGCEGWLSLGSNQRSNGFPKKSR